MAYTTIKKPSDYFNTNLYTGNNTQTSHTVGFQPDFTWLKVRNAVGNHYLYDAVRGANKDINANDSTAEYTATQNLMSFDANGYTVGTSNSINTNGETMVGWNWKANGAGSANTDGSISSTVSANTTSGFSIVSYTGTGANATVGHGLGVAPKFMIFKNRNGGFNWNTYHSAYSPAQSQEFNTTNLAENTGSVMWNSTATTSSVFSIGTTGSVNQSSAPIIAYCFAEKQGFSKFGSYTGNGNADGTFVYTGFKPAFVIVKRTDATQGWYILDNKRNTFNPEDKYLETNDADAEATFTFCDFLSNGFKARTTGTGFNASGGSYIYMAFAEAPLVGDNPCTAR